MGQREAAFLQWARSVVPEGLAHVSADLWLVIAVVFFVVTLVWSGLEKNLNRDSEDGGENKQLGKGKPASRASNVKGRKSKGIANERSSSKAAKKAADTGVKRKAGRSKSPAAVKSAPKPRYDISPSDRKLNDYFRGYINFEDAQKKVASWRQKSELDVLIELVSQGKKPMASVMTKSQQEVKIFSKLLEEEGMTVGVANSKWGRKDSPTFIVSFTSKPTTPLYHFADCAWIQKTCDKRDIGIANVSELLQKPLLAYLKACDTPEQTPLEVGVAFGYDLEESVYLMEQRVRKENDEKKRLEKLREELVGEAE